MAESGSSSMHLGKRRCDAEIEDIEEKIERTEENIEDTKKEIQETKKEIEDTEKKIEDTKKEIEQIKKEIQETHDKATQEVLRCRSNTLSSTLDLLLVHRNWLLEKRNLLLPQFAKKTRKKFKESVPECQEPSYITVAASKAKSTDISQKQSSGDVYHHWFAVALYDFMLELQKKQEGQTLTFLDMDMPIPSTQLTALIKHWQNGLAANDEQHCTAGLAVQLNNFLFTPSDDGNDPVGSLCHQMPLCYYQDKPDFIVLPFPSNGFSYDASKFVAVSDFKLSNFEKVKTESYAYLLKGARGYHDRVRVVFPCTKHRAQLIVTVPQNRSIVSICVYDSIETYSWGRLFNPETFLCMLFAAVHYLLRNPEICTRGYLCPTRDIELLNDVAFVHYPQRTSRVLRSPEENLVYKLIDTKEDQVQEHIAALVLPRVKVVSLSSDGRYKYLCYEYLPGHHGDGGKGCVTAQQVMQILNQLHLIHQEGYVHSDIRLLNLVFSDDEQHAWIIDFDLADKVNETYPDGYNYLEVRHREARAGLPREKVHDVHTLNVLMKKLGFNDIMASYVQGVPLCDITVTAIL